MKKLTMISVIAVLALLLSFSTVFAADDAITVYLDGEQITLTTDAVLESGRTLVPFRSIFEAMGLEVDWKPETQTVSGTAEGIEIELVIDSTTATVNGEEKTLDVAPSLKNGSTMIPLRFVAESVGSKVEWVEAKNQVKIWSVDESAAEIVAKINEATPDADSIAMKMTSKVEAEVVEAGVASKMTMDMTGDIKTVVNGDKVEMAMIMKATAVEGGETTNIDMETYFRDGVMYMTIDGEKVKLEMDVEAAAAQMQAQPVATADIKFDDSIKGSRVEEKEDGSCVVTLVMDADALNDTMAASLEQSLSLLEGMDEGISAADIKIAYGDVIMEIVADKDFNMTAVNMITSADVAIGEDSMTMDLTVTMEITEIGKDVKITFPTDLNSYKDFADYLKDAAAAQ